MENQIIGYLCKGEIVDIHQYSSENNGIPITINSQLGMEIVRHSTAHLLAHAISIIFPDAHFGKGPITDHGFFYDVSLINKITDQDLLKIQKQMLKLVDQGVNITYNVQSRPQLQKQFENDVLKSVIIKNIPCHKVLSTYTQGNFIDLCKGPHLQNTKDIPKSFKITHVENVTDHLQRIHGVSFYSKDTLKQYLNKTVDHRTIVKNMDLAYFNSASPAMVFWKKNAIKIVEKLIYIIRKVTDNFTEVVTPPIASNDLWKLTGHFDQYNENMFFIHNHQLALKPMNCPLHCFLFSEVTRSYKELPFRISEFGKVFRNEYTGGLIGLKRLQHFTQDDGHVFCMPDQCFQEIENFITSAKRVYNLLGLKETGDYPDFIFKLSTSSDHLESNKVLEDVLINYGVLYTIAQDEGAFYGPKIEMHIRDYTGKYWQCGTIQLDKQISKKLNVQYIDNQDKLQYPIVLHRAILGSIERFLGIYLETYSLPFWLHPIQIVICSVNESHIFKVQEISQKLQNFETIVDISNQSINKKIRIATCKKIPYIIVVGDKEIHSDIVTIRYENKITECSLSKFIEQLDLKNKVF